MSFYRYAVSSDAISDLDSIEEYVAQFREPFQVNDLMIRFEEKFSALTEDPLQYPVYRFEPPMDTLHDYRTVNLDLFKIFFWVDGDIVRIYRIRHLQSDFTKLCF